MAWSGISSFVFFLCLIIPQGISTDRITLDRQVLEYNCLGLMESIIPGSAPKPYCLDRTHNISKVIVVKSTLKPILHYALGLHFGNPKCSKAREKAQPARVFTQHVV